MRLDQLTLIKKRLRNLPALSGDHRTCFTREHCWIHALSNLISLICHEDFPFVLRDMVWQQDNPLLN
jgi:hypothetical protein